MSGASPRDIAEVGHATEILIEVGVRVAVRSILAVIEAGGTLEQVKQICKDKS